MVKLNFKISLVIPTYHRRDLLVANIKMLEYQTFEEDFEVICVIDGTQDGTLEALQTLKTSFPLTVIYQENRGAAAARNTGAKAAKGQVLLFLDDDMEACEDLLLEHYRSHLKGANIVIGHIPYHPNEEETQLFKWFLEKSNERFLDLKKRKQLRFTDFFSGQVSVEKDLFFSVKGFDENYNLDNVYGLEDYDLGYRLLKIESVNFVFNPRAVSYQKFDISPSLALSRHMMTGHNFVYLRRKIPKIKRLYPINAPRKKWKLLLRDIMVDFSLFFPWGIMGISWTLNQLALKMYKLKLKERPLGVLFSRASSLNYWKGIIIAGGFPNSKCLRVLSYHSNSTDNQDAISTKLAVSPNALKKQIKILKRLRFQFITPAEFLRFIQGRSLLPKRAVLLTFDDAYEDFFEQALPILQKERVSAFLFAASGLIGGLNEWDIKKGAKAIRLLNAEKLRLLTETGFAIGAHSKSHAFLIQLKPSELNIEIDSMLDDFNNFSLPIPNVFAYPYGQYNDSIVKAIKKAGFKAGFATDLRLFQQSRNPYRIPRMVVKNHHKLLLFIVKFFITARFKKA